MSLKKDLVIPVLHSFVMYRLMGASILLFHSEKLFILVLRINVIIHL